MKAIPTFLAILSLSVLSPVVPSAPAGAAPPEEDNGNHYGRDAARACREFLLPFVPEANLGECVSFVQTFGTEGFPAHFCDSELETNPDFEESWGSYEECVQEVRALMRESEL